MVHADAFSAFKQQIAHIIRLCDGLLRALHPQHAVRDTHDAGLSRCADDPLELFQPRGASFGCRRGLRSLGFSAAQPLNSFGDILEPGIFATYPPVGLQRFLRASQGFQSSG